MPALLATATTLPSSAGSKIWPRMRRTGDSIDKTPIGVDTRPEVFLAMRRVSSSAVNVARPSPSGISAI